MISSLVGMRFPMNTYQGERTSQRKQFQLNVTTSLIWDNFFFKGRFPFLHMLRLFQDSFIFGESTSSHFLRVPTSTQQLLFWSSYFFRAAAFFEELPFQISCVFIAKLLPSSHFRVKISTEEPFIEAGTSAKDQLFEKS